MMFINNMFFVTFMWGSFVLPAVLGITGFQNENVADLRRQIPFQHDPQVLQNVPPNRFSVPQNVPGQFRPAQNEFIPQPSVELNPIQFGHNSQFIQQPPQQYRLLSQQSSRALPESNSFELNNQQFLDDNNQFLPRPTLQSGIAFQQQNFLQNNSPQNLQQIQQPSQVPLQTFNTNQLLPSQRPTAHSFLPTIPADTNNFPQNQQLTPTSLPNPSFGNDLNTNPLLQNDQSQQFQNFLEEQRKQDLERLKELQERQKIIQKHKQFLERQQQKQQQKVQKLHEEFVAKQKKKQDEIYATLRPIADSSVNPVTGRDIYPHELSLFEKAIKQQESLKPTTTAPEPSSTKKTVSRNRSRQRSKNKENDSSESYQVSVRSKNNKQGKSSSTEDSSSEEDKLQYIGRQDLLKQLKLALVENSNDINIKNFTSREIALPNGEKFEVIRTSDPNLIAGATPLSGDGSSFSQLLSQNQLVRKPVKQPKLSFEDITKGVLPPGADFEVIKQTNNGNLEEVDKIPSSIPEQKKVTFVFIEEQNDGSYQVKGVRGNEDSKDVNNPDVENVLKKIKDGQIKFPTATRQPESVTSTSPPRTYSSSRETAHTTRAGSTYSKVSSRKPTSQKYEPKVTSTTPKYFNSPSPSSLSINHNGSPSSPSPENYDTASSYVSTTPSSSTYFKSTRDNRYPNVTPNYEILSTLVNGHQMHSTNKYDSSPISTYENIESSHKRTQVPDLASATTSSFIKNDQSSSGAYYTGSNVASRSTSTSRPSLEEASSQIAYSNSVHVGLTETLKENGLFAAAKYIKQSGLDTILNETGPYTVFAPTDKAFRTLLIQLGGPDKAEEKFKENPRLLSGLLLHHIIPGAFEISILQDEMTGVSLAGTQLRVNQYDMHDVEWNEIKVTTINGARVLNEKQDIRIPQGIAHAVDRVMFPLPVGDIVQTLQADRERRFTNFLKALFNSGMVEALSDSRTYTVFAPVDKAFASLTTDELHTLVTDKEKSKDLVTKHIAPGTLFSAGMRYYQIRDTMAQEKPITLQKNAGRIKVNSGHVVTHNIPATNGVIHAVDMLL